MKWKRGGGYGFNRNIMLRTYGLNPYNYFKHIDTPFGRVVHLVSPLLESYETLITNSGTLNFYNKIKFKE